MSKIDRQDNTVHSHGHVHTHMLENVHADMYTGNYREVYQSSGISRCLNACEQAIPPLPARLHREGTGIKPSLLSLYLFFSLLCSPSQSLLSFLFSVSHFCVCVRAPGLRSLVSESSAFARHS